MNAVKHAEISVYRCGGQIDDYYPIHSFIDCTKELCSDNRHRILHTMWGIKRVIIPIFGHTIINSDGKSINVKDLCERDHILADYRNRFIPTLTDFVNSIDEDALPKDFTKKIQSLHQQYAHQKEVAELLLSPLAQTGRMSSLLITHNSWFLNNILPKIFPVTIQLQNFELSPTSFFEAMNFQIWMDNGASFPPSAQRNQDFFEEKIIL
ncbi:MAG: hypothetical protein AB8H03_15825 [Saprospiraceae bacterium]